MYFPEPNSPDLSGISGEFAEETQVSIDKSIFTKVGEFANDMKGKLHEDSKARRKLMGITDPYLLDDPDDPNNAQPQNVELFVDRKPMMFGNISFLTISVPSLFTQIAQHLKQLAQEKEAKGLNHVKILRIRKNYEILSNEDYFKDKKAELKIIGRGLQNSAPFHLEEIKLIP